MQSIIDLESSDIDGTARSGDGGTYLVVTYDGDEFPVALRFAIRQAQAHRGHVGILHVIEGEEFQHWENIESKIRHEMRDQAEQYVWGVAGQVHEFFGEMPAIYIEEGEKNDVVLDVINNDPNIVQLVLGAGTSTSGPGPLTSYVTGKGLKRLPVPVVVVPAHVTPAKLDELAG